jgi:hypothetical protein
LGDAYKFNPKKNPQTHRRGKKMSVLPLEDEEQKDVDWREKMHIQGFELILEMNPSDPPTMLNAIKGIQMMEDALDAMGEDEPPTPGQMERDMQLCDIVNCLIRREWDPLVWQVIEKTRVVGSKHFPMGLYGMKRVIQWSTKKMIEHVAETLDYVDVGGEK